MRRGVLWDMDGVLVDTGEYHYQSWVLALGEAGISLDRETFRKTFGMNNRGILQLLGGERADERFIQEMSDRKESWFRQAVHGRVEPLPGVRTWLERLHSQQVRMAVASSAPQANIDAIIDELGIRRYFTAVVSAAEMPGKPDPMVFLVAAERIGVAPEHCIVVEDAIPGVEAAKNAGMRCMAVTTTNPAQTLNLADVVVERLSDLPEDAFERLWEQ